MTDDIYILTAERDTFDKREDSRAIAFEQYTDNGAASLKNVKAFQKRLGDKYGKTRIAKLEFIDNEFALDAISLLNNQEKCNELLESLNEIATDVCSYEYGLPIYDDNQKAALREAIYQWAAK